MNQQQISSVLRLLFAIGGPVAALIIAKTGISRDDYDLYLQAFLVVAPPCVVAVITWRRNSSDQQIRITSELPEVHKVVVNDSANGETGKMARSEEHPNIVTASQNIQDEKVKP